MRLTVIVLVVMSGLARPVFAVENLSILPGKSGFGMETPAGSGRHLSVPNTSIIKVTNLNTSGPGSFREALETEGPRVIVFEVSGNIDFTPYSSLFIKHPYVTVAGQTAPSPGITLQGAQLHVSTHDVLLQHIRIRVGDLLDPNQPKKYKNGWNQWSERDSMKLSGERLVIDHCSFSWATDENVQSRANDLTFIQNIFSEGLSSKKHHKGGHSRGLLVMNQGKAGTRDEGQRIAIIGNLFAHNKGRNPAVNGGVEAVIANNLIVDANFAIKSDESPKRKNYQLVSVIGNVIKRTRYPFVARATHSVTRYYFSSENQVNGKTYDSSADVWKDVFMPFKPGVAKENRAIEAPVDVPELALIHLDEVEEWVLLNAGARPAGRDPVDVRIVKSVREGTGNIISSQSDVGGWPKLAKNYHKLILPENPMGDDDNDGYTNLEEWLHKYAAEVEGRDYKDAVTSRN